MKFCLDAGHYGKYNRSPAVNTYYESDMNWKLHLLLKKYLEEYEDEKHEATKVILTRDNQATDLEVSARGRKAEGCKALFSIHSNAVGSVVNESVDYPVVYVPLNGSGNDIGNKLADCIQKTMGTKQDGRIATRQGNNGDYYGIIRGAVSVGVPGIILEHSFHTNTKSTKWLMDDSNLDKMAKAEAEVIAKHYGLKKPVKAENICGIYRVKSTDGFLNLRAGNDVSFPVVEELATESLVGVLGDSGNGWVLTLSQSGCIGYCNKAYLSRV